MKEINIEISIEEDNWRQECNNNEEIIRAACIRALEVAGITASAQYIEISVLLTNDESIKLLNRDYRGKDKPTNVLSFPLEEFVPGNYEEADEQMVLGDIIFALETIKKESEEQNKSFYDHLSHLAVHGTLHLIGYDHEDDSDAEVMEALEVKVLSELGIANPY